MPLARQPLFYAAESIDRRSNRGFSKILRGMNQHASGLAGARISGMMDRMQEQAYLFIDGGHLRQQFRNSIDRWYGEACDFDVQRVNNFFSASKCFYYDCVDEKRNGESETDFKNRAAIQEANFDRISEVAATHVRLGSLSGSGKKRRQKKVDVQLAVDAMNHAARRNMSRAIFLTGDQDFLPVVQALVDMGLFVDVAGDKRHTSRDLARAADTYRPLSLFEYCGWTTNVQKPPPLPQKYYKRAPGFHRWKLLKTGTLDNKNATLYQIGEGDHVIAQQERDGGFTMIRLSGNIDRLILFCEIDLGTVELADQK
jgi:uncharacterized LabA/DUF88 family protein